MGPLPQTHGAAAAMLATSQPQSRLCAEPGEARRLAGGKVAKAAGEIDDLQNPAGKRQSRTADRLALFDQLVGSR